MSNIKKDQTLVLLVSSITEFGERYSYYIIQSLLIFFLIDKFKISQAESSVLVGTVLSMVYISAIIGGFIADKLIGNYRAAFLGAVLMIIGSSVLTLTNSQNMLFVGLTFIAISTGLIKSNISAFIGNFYNKAKLNDSYRDFGFSIFYMGINIGSTFALFAASFVKDNYGFGVAFFTSIIATIIMLVNLLIGFYKLRDYTNTKSLTVATIVNTIAVLVLYMLTIFLILKNPFIANISILLALFLCIIIIFYSKQKKYSKNITLACLFFILSIIYWTVFFQTIISILVYLDEIVNHKFLFLNIGSTQFLLIESLSIIILSPLVGRFWLYCTKLNKSISGIDKFNLGFIFQLLSFAIFYLGVSSGNSYEKSQAIFFIIGFIVLALGELCLSASGLSLVTKIAPPGFVSLYMGIWLVTMGIGGKLAGFLAKDIIISKDIAISKINMQHGLYIFMAITLVGSMLCLVLRKKIITIENKLLAEAK